jgi:hypothetical protein
MIRLDGPVMNSLAHIHSRAFKREPPSSRVLVFSDNELIYGTGTGSACSIKMRGNSMSRTVWSVSFDLNPGTFTPCQVHAICILTMSE